MVLSLGQKGLYKIKIALHISICHKDQYSNATPSLDNRWMEIAKPIKLCSKCPLHTILPKP
jgi:hypothetical protein